MDDQTQKHSGKRHDNLAMRLCISLLLCALTLGMKHWYPQAAQAVRPWIIGQEDNRVMQAFSNLTTSVEQGNGVGQAVQAFYEDMTGHAVP